MMYFCTNRNRAKVGTMVMNDSGDYDDKMASHLAYLTKHIAQIMESLRKLEAHDANAVKKMPPAQQDKLVQAYIADLPKERRAALRARRPTASRCCSPRPWGDNVKFLR